MRGYGARPAFWAGAACILLVAAGFGGWQLLKPAASTSGPSIVVGTTNAAATLDPAGGYDAGSWALYSNIYQSLLTLIPGNDQPVPDAAESCGFSDRSLRVYRCELRSDVKFSSGRQMTAEDVVYSFQRTFRINDDRAPVVLFNNLDSVRTEGETVVFRLKAPDAVFPFKIAGGAGAIVDPDHYEPDAIYTGDSVVGSGPFLLTGYEAGRSVELEPNPDYVGPMPTATSAVSVRYFADSDTLSAAWKKGELDVNDGHIPPADLTSLPSSRNSLVESEGIDIRVLAFNTRAGSAMHQTPLRQAVAAVVDRQQIATRAHMETVDPLFSLIPDGLSGHADPYLYAYPEPSMETAEELLTQAGATLPVAFEVAYSKGPAARQEAEQLAEQLDRTGLFKVTATHYGWDEFLLGMSEGKFDAYTLGWSPDYPDPETYTGPLLGTNGTMTTGYSNKAVDAAIQETRINENRSDVGEDFKRIQELAADDVPVLPLWQARDYVLSTPEVYGAEYLRDFNGTWALWQLSWARA